MNHEYSKSSLASFLINCITARVSRLLSQRERRSGELGNDRIGNKGGILARMRRCAFNERSLLTWPLLIAAQSDASRRAGTHARSRGTTFVRNNPRRAMLGARFSISLRRAGGRDIVLIQKYRTPGTGLYIAFPGDRSL